MTIKLSVDRIEGGQAVLITEHKQEISWPLASLPDGIKEGQILNFTISDNEKATEEKDKLAKDILNEILTN